MCKEYKVEELHESTPFFPHSSQCGVLLPCSVIQPVTKVIRQGH